MHTQVRSGQVVRSSQVSPPHLADFWIEQTALVKTVSSLSVNTVGCFMVRVSISTCWPDLFNQTHTHNQEVQGGPWLPDTFSHPTYTCSVHNVATQSLFGATALSGLLPLQFLGILYQTKVLDHSCSSQRRSAPPSHLQVQTLQKHAGKFRLSPFVFCPGLSRCHPLLALCLSFSFVWTLLLQTPLSSFSILTHAS